MNHSDYLYRQASWERDVETFFQFRVRLYLQVILFFYAAFVVMGLFKWAILKHTGWPEALDAVFNATLVYLVPLAILAGAWMYLNRKPQPPVVLRSVESAVTLLASATLVAVIPMVPENMSPLLLLNFVILALVIRAALVPSRTVQTFVLGILAPLPVAIAVGMHGAGADPVTRPDRYYGGWMVMSWGLVFAVATTLVSWVIYGLRERIRTMGAYRLVERLGSGAMGEVWHAEHHLLIRPAAVKLIKEKSVGMQGEGAKAVLTRFEREAQATASLCSPHTIQLFDFGRTDDGSFYYVMELLDGLDLKSLVERFGPQPAARVVSILKQACHSLHEAHCASLIHRDIKPANIFLCRYGADVDFVKVLDFGLAQHYERPADPRITSEGVTVGTPAFMAPEAIMREGDLDGRADIYSLGCVAYFLLTGRLVFEADSAMAMLVKHARESPVGPSQRTELEVPRALEALVMRCLQKRPIDRPTSADLAQSLRELQISGWEPSVAERWWRHHTPKAPPRVLKSDASWNTPRDWPAPETPPRPADTVIDHPQTERRPPVG